MFASHWNLVSAPFHDTAGVFFHQGPAQSETLARLDYLVENHRRVGLLLGKRGVGKTLLTSELKRKWASSAQVAKVSLHGANTEEMLWQIAAQLGLNPPLDDSPFRTWRRLEDHLAECSLARTPVIVLLDDIDEAYADAVPQIARLAQIDAVGELQLTLILTAHWQRLKRLGRRLLDLVDLRVELTPWEELDVRNYLSASLKAAGCSVCPFDDQAIARIFEFSGGLPRIVRQIAEFALIAGAASRLDTITADVIDSVQGEFNPSESRSAALV